MIHTKMYLNSIVFSPLIVPNRYALFSWISWISSIVIQSVGSNVGLDLTDFHCMNKNGNLKYPLFKEIVFRRRKKGLKQHAGD